MVAFYALLLVLTLVNGLYAEWIPDHCPTSCICLETWNDKLLTKLNAVDCKGGFHALNALSVITEAEIVGG